MFTLLILSALCIQVKELFDATLKDEGKIHQQLNTAVCNVFKSISNDPSLEVKVRSCANLGNGEFELHTYNQKENLDSILSRQLNRRHDIEFPFKVALASEDRSTLPSPDSDQTAAPRISYSNHKAYVNFNIPARSYFLMNRLSGEFVLSFSIMILIGAIFMNVLKSLRDVHSPHAHNKPTVTGEKVFQIGRYSFDVQNQTLIFDQKARRITEKESQILNYLCSRRNQIVRRDEILIALWGESDYFKGRSLDVFIARLRKYLSQDYRLKIESIHGVGFVLSEDGVRRLEG